MDGEKNKITVLNVLQLDNPTRVDLWIKKQMPNLSRAKIQKLIQGHKILLNDKPCKPKELLNVNDVIVIDTSSSQGHSNAPVAMDLDIVYEDRDLIVLNKPAGLNVHPGAGDYEPTLVHGLLAHTKELSTCVNQGTFRPGIVHRLDKNTTGLLVCAKNNHSHAHLAQQFKDKTNIRSYYALLDGVLPQDQLTIESYLSRDKYNRLKFASIDQRSFDKIDSDQQKKYRWAKSLFTLREVYGHRFSLVEVQLHTGRTHQIRVHCESLKLPIWGDPIYNHSKDLPNIFSKDEKVKLNSIHRQCLHAKTLGFIHPRSGDTMVFDSPLPKDFEELLGILRPYKII